MKPGRMVAPSTSNRSYSSGDIDRLLRSHRQDLVTSDENDRIGDGVCTGTVDQVAIYQSQRSWLRSDFQV